MRFYSPVGRGVSLLRAQGSISYVQSDKETYDMDDWIEKLASQYGAKQAAALRGDETTFKAADMWLASIAEHHWHEIIAALRILRASGALRTELCVTNVKNKGTKNERTID